MRVLGGLMESNDASARKPRPTLTRSGMGTAGRWVWVAVAGRAPSLQGARSPAASRLGRCRQRHARLWTARGRCEPSTWDAQKGVAQSAARLVWDQEVAGASPAPLKGPVAQQQSARLISEGSAVRLRPGPTRPSGRAARQRASNSRDVGATPTWGIVAAPRPPALRCWPCRHPD